MKIYVSVDIEGVACIAAPGEADPERGESAPYREQMTREAAVACDAAFAAGATAIVVKDAHGPARNIDPRGLRAPDGATLELIRGWSGHPFAMVQGIDSTFAMAAFVGFHSAAGSGGNPLSHTVSSRSFTRVELNEQPASEFLLYAMAASSVGVPVGFLSGDQALCDEAEARVEGIVTVAAFEGIGSSVRSLLPDEVVRRVGAGVRKAIVQPRARPIAVPADLAFKLTFIRPSDAYAKSFYPGARLVANNAVLLESSRVMDMLTFLRFAKV